MRSKSLPSFPGFMTPLHSVTGNGNCYPGSDALATANTIKSVADKIGVDKVAMGSDFDGANECSYDINGF